MERATHTSSGHTQQLEVTSWKKREPYLPEQDPRPWQLNNES